jgi:hypothetical protein
MPATVVPLGARICCLYNTEIQPKCHNNSKKEREGEEEKGVRRRW